MNKSYIARLNTEKILGLISIISFLLQKLKIPGGEFLLVISLMLLSLVYVFFTIFSTNKISITNAFKLTTYKQISILRLMGTVFLGFVLSVACLAILFNLQNWHGARYFSMTGIIFSSVAFFVVSYKYFVTKSCFYLRLIIRIVIIGVLALATFVVN